MRRKGLDMIVANDVSPAAAGSSAEQVDIGFNSEYNALHVFWTGDNPKDTAQISGEQHFDVARKSQLATQLIALIAKQYNLNRSHNAKNTA